MAGTEFIPEEMHPIGSITALIPEAADAAISGAIVADGRVEILISPLETSSLLPPLESSISAQVLVEK